MKSRKRQLVAFVFALLMAAMNNATLHAQTVFLPPIDQPPIPMNAAGTSAKDVRAAESYGKLPLSFEANLGQTDRQVEFFSRGSGYALFLTSNETVLALKQGNPARTQSPSVPTAFVKEASSETTDLLRIRLLGAKLGVRMRGVNELPGKVNYFLGNDPTKWRTNIPTYAKVEYEKVYPGINLVYYGSQRQLEYDFVVAPGGDPKVIRLLVHGAKKLTINEQGALVLATQNGKVEFARPNVYQEIGGKRHAVFGKYALMGSNTVGFIIGDYRGERPLVIDPVLVYSTYLGGSGRDNGYGITVDSSGNAYITGATSSTDFPTVNPIQSGCGTCASGFRDAFVTKINASGSVLLYSTYLGGSEDDLGQGIAVDSSGNTYVTGVTSSTDFPTVNAIQPTCGGCTNQNSSGDRRVFVTKINATGSALIYSTYLGGSECLGESIAVASGNAYVTGLTRPGFPTVNALQPSFGGSAGYYNAFVAEINASGSALLYSTYLGSESAGSSIALDSSGNAYITGYTSSTNFPTVNAIQSSCGSCASGLNNAFVTKINATGSALIYSTYLGGSNYDYGNGIAVDSTGNAYVTGNTRSPDFPTVNAIQSKFAGGSYDAFVTKINASGSALLYSTYLGGTSDDVGIGIAADSSGNAYVTGYTQSTDFPTVNALQSNNIPSGGGSGDAFVTKINANGSAPLYSTYLGGSNDDWGYGIAVDSAGNAYITGYTQSTDFPTVNAFQSSHGGSSSLYNAFVAKVFSALSLSPSRLTFSNQPVGTASTPQTASLRNDGNSALTISSLAISGTNASEFAETDNCVGSVPVGTSCSINVIFTPAATGSRLGILSIANSFTGSPLAVPITGTGITATRIANLSATSLTFASEMVGTTSAAQALTLSNTGNVELVISNLSISGTNGSEFAETDNCGGSLSAGANCTINVTFSPATTGTRTGTLNIADNATSPQSPQIVQLIGSGIAPIANVSPSSITFPNQYVGTSGLPQTVTLTNTGTAPLSIKSVTTSPADFGQLSSCGNSLSAGSSCSIGVFFDPTASGSRTGALTVSDNAGGNPQTVTLAGTGVDFSVVPSSASTVTITRGQTASYSLTVAPNGGFNQSVAFVCTGAPAQSTCAASPNPVALNGSTAATVTVTVTTAAASILVHEPPVSNPPPIAAYRLVFLISELLALPLLACLLVRRKERRPRLAYGLALLLLLCAGMTMSACGGGGGGSNIGGGSGNPGTPSGNYTLAVSGTFTSGSTTLSHTTDLILVVQ